MKRLIKEIISSNGKYKATIKLRSDETYEIDILQFNHEVCEPFWEPVPNMTTSIVDTLSNAEKIGVEKIEEAINFRTGD